jgi:hypothetical protein
MSCINKYIYIYMQSGMKDGDEIDAMLHVDGGGGRLVQ